MPNPPYFTKLDLELRDCLIAKSLHEKYPTEKAYRVDPNKRFAIGVEFTGDFAPLQDAGFSAKDIYDQTAYGFAELETVEKLAKLPAVIHIETQKENVIQK